MSPSIDTATEGIVFSRISGFCWAIGAGNRNPVQWPLEPSNLLVDVGLRVLSLSLLGQNPRMGFVHNLGKEEQVVAAEGIGGLPACPVSVQAVDGDVVAGMAYEMRLVLQGICKRKDAEEARKLFRTWCDGFTRCGDKPAICSSQLQEKLR